MPATVSRLCKEVVAALPNGPAQTYKPEAGIVNFYQLKHTLTAHQDEAEVSSLTPLVSLSVGHSCIFLVSPSKDQPPLALRIRSGDAVVMMGLGRRSWHGVPRVLDESPDWLVGDGWRRWLREGGRVNANVRQVFD